MQGRKVVLICMGIVILLLIGLRVYFNADRLRTLLIPQLSTALKRSVVLEDAALGLWGGVHVSVLGLDVAERQPFGTKPFLSVAEANIYVQFWPLLRGEVMIEQIDLVRPQVSVVILKNGDTNYADLSQGSETSDSKGSAFFVQDVTVVDGLVWYADLGKEMDVTLADIDYTLEIVQKENVWDVNGDLGIGRVGWQEGGQQDTLDTGVLHLRHQIEMAQDAWTLTAVDLSWAGLTVTTSGSMKVLDDVLDLDLTIKEPGLDLGTTKLRDVAQLPVDMTGRASVHVRVTGAVNLSATPPQYPEIEGRVSLSKVDVLGDESMGTVRIDTAEVDLVDGVLLSHLRGQALGGLFSISGRATPVWPPHTEKPFSVTLDAQTDVLNLQGLNTESESTPPNYDQILTGLRSVDARVSVKIGHLIMAGIEAKDVVCSNFRLENGLLRLGELKAQTYGGDVRLAGMVDMRTERPEVPIDLAVDANGLDLASLLNDGLDMAGRLTMALQVRGGVNGVMPLVVSGHRLAVLGNVSVTEGRMKTPALLVPVDSLFLAVAFLKNNIVKINQMSARAGKSDLLMNGRVNGLVDHILNVPSERPDVVAHVRADFLDLDAMFPTTLPVTGDQTSGLLMGMRAGDGRVDVSVGTLVSDSTQYGDFKAIMIAKNGLLQVDSIRANTLGGTMRAQARVEGRDTGLIPVQAMASLTNMGAERVIQEYMGWPIPIFGQLGVSVSLDGHMDSTLTLVEKTLRAEGEARMDDGRVVNWPWLQTTSGLVPHLQFLNFSNLPVRSLVAPFRLEKGRVFLNQMGFGSGEVGFQFAGSVGIDGSLDMTVDASVPASRLNMARLGLDRLPGVNVKPDAKIPLRIQISGTSDKPKVDAKLQPEAQKALEGKSEELKNKAKDKAKGFLKSLF